MSAFIPISIDVVGTRTVVRWIERPDVPSTTPFFLQMTRELLASGARQRVTPVDALFTAHGRDPAGLVMHMSRCGSTLLMQSLALSGCVAPVTEATPVNQLLSRDLPEPERALLLRALIRALVSLDDAATPLPAVIKFTSWNVLFLDVIRAAFPNTPWLFVYREPLEVLASHGRGFAPWLSDDFLDTLARARRVPSFNGLRGEQRCAAMLAAYGQTVLGMSPGPANLLSYRQLPEALQIDVPARFGLTTSAVQRERIVNACRIYSKDPSRTVVFDPVAERRVRPVTDGMREADARHTHPVYLELERRRTGAPDVS
jgi:hypothetical protein